MSDKADSVIISIMVLSEQRLENPAENVRGR